MRIINIWQCWLKGIWDSILTLIGTGYPMSGHDWVEKEIHQNTTVVITQCEKCGKEEISWHKN